MGGFVLPDMDLDFLGARPVDLRDQPVRPWRHGNVEDRLRGDFSPLIPVDEYLVGAPPIRKSTAAMNADQAHAFVAC